MHSAPSCGVCTKNTLPSLHAQGRSPKNGTNMQQTLPPYLKGGGGSISGVTHFLPPHMPTDFSRNGDVWANDFRHLATLENVIDDFAAWWRPTEKRFARVVGGGREYPVLFTTQWDGCPWGRIGTIVRSAPKRDQGLLYKFFSQLDPVDSVIPELRQVNRHARP